MINNIRSISTLKISLINSDPHIRADSHIRAYNPIAVIIAVITDY